MKTFKYIGDDPVDLPTLDLLDVTKGTHVKVEDTNVSDDLEKRPEFEHLPDPARSAAAKKAAEAATEKES